MRTITLEEHFAPPGFLDGAGRQLRDAIAKTGARGAKILEQLVEIGERRIADLLMLTWPPGVGWSRLSSAARQTTKTRAEHLLANPLWFQFLALALGVLALAC